jgi:large subunit ribosomal protein L25
MTKLNVQKRDANMSLDAIRAEGKVPGVCYGSEFESTPVSFDRGEFRKLYKEAGNATIIELDGDLKGEQCFVHDMQVHVTSGEILHVDLKVVAAGQTTEVAVPVEVEGEAPAVTNKLGLLRIGHSELNVEAIPSKVPSEIIVDVSGLENVGDKIKVSDLKLPEGVEVIDDADMTVVSISGLQEEKEEDENAPSMEDVLADPNAEAEEGEAPTEESSE